MQSEEEPEDQHAFEAMNAYLDAARAGDLAARARLLGEHPELAAALECLDALEALSVDSCSKSDVTLASDDQLTAASGPEDESDASDWIAWKLPMEFGAYELLKELGRGGMGVVYLARQKNLDRLVALKMVLGSHLASNDSVHRFQAECRLAAGMQHPRIVSVFEAGQVHGQNYLAMQFIEGESLARRIAEETIAPRDAASCLAEIARAVEYLHAAGVVHRDLKPSNVLLDSEECPYVTDFGLAKAFDDGAGLTQTGERLGTASYMAPEQAAGRAELVGPLSDVYSLGAILYEMLTGRPPFRGESALDTLVQVVEREPELPRRLNPAVPRALEMIALKCLEKLPQDRYESAAALADDLERYLHGESVEAAPPSVGARAMRWVRREPALALRLGALAGFCLVELLSYHVLKVADLYAFHLPMLLIAAMWGGASIVCQQWLKVGRWRQTARFVWVGVDAMMLFAALMVGDGVASGLVVVYPLLIVGSGLWSQVRMVWFMTSLAVISYSALACDFHLRRADVASRYNVGLDRHLAFILSIVVLGAVTAHLVRRLRALGRYYEQRRRG